MLDIGKFIQSIRSQGNVELATALEKVQDAANFIGTQIGVNPAGKQQEPPPIEAVNVAAGNGMVHVALTHNAPISKNIQYFTEWSNDSGGSWHVVHHGASREATIPLPAKTVTGSATQNYIFRSYAQYLGSDATAQKTYFGGSAAPTVVNLTGTTALDLLPATGSGTAAPNGQQGGLGLGSNLQRLPLGPKRGVL